MAEFEIGGDHQLQDDVERYFSVDVECFATGRGHSDRAPVTVAVVDETENVVLDATIELEPGLSVASYFTELTGLNEESYGLRERQSLSDVIERVKELLGPNAVLVGQGISNDIKWLRLVEGIDFKRSIDLANIFTVTSTYKGKEQKSTYALQHVVQTLLPGKGKNVVHLASDDALNSMKLYNQYGNASDSVLKQAHNKLLKSKPQPSWAKRHDYCYEDVCLAGYYEAKCRCGQPSLKN